MLHLLKYGLAGIVATSNTLQHFKLGAFDTESTLERYGRYLSDVNKGAMLALQANPDDTSSDCFIQTEKTSEKIMAMVNAENYSTSNINTAEFI